MQNTPPKYAKKLYEIVSEVEDLPEDDYENLDLVDDDDDNTVMYNYKSDSDEE